MLATWLTSLKYNVRLFTRDWPFLVASILALGLGIGASTATFGIIYELWLRPLPFNEPDRIVQVVRAGPNGIADLVSVPLVRGWQNAEGVEAFAAYNLYPVGLNLETNGEPRRVAGLPVGGEFFRVFGVPAEIGRTLTLDDTRSGAPLVTVLSDRVWRTQFNHDLRIVGTAIRMNKDLYTVVGIMSPAFRFPTSADMWIPLQLSPSSNDPTNLYLAVARLKPGVSTVQVMRQLNVIMAAVAKDLPAGTFSGIKTIVVPLQEYLAGNTRLLISVVSAAVALVLLIACINFASLLLASLSAHSKDIAIRIALGANRLRLARELLGGSVLLAVTGCGVGVVFAWFAGNLATRFLTAMPHISGSIFSVPVFLFAVVLSVSIGIVVGITPLFHMASIPVEQALRDDSDRAIGGRGRPRLRRAIVVGEVALSVLLLVGVGLFTKILLQLLRADAGFEARNVLTFEMSYPQTLCTNRERFNVMFGSMLSSLGTIPGVRNAASTSTLPLERGPDLPFTLTGNGGQEIVGEAEFRVISPDYFTALRIPLRQGRMFGAEDMAKSEPVVIVNQQLAQQYWPGGDALGQYLTVAKVLGPEWSDRGPRRVVGIVGNVRELSLDKDAPPAMFVPYLQVAAPVLSSLMFCEIPSRFVIKTTMAVGPLIESVKQRVQGIDAAQAVAEIKPMETIVANSTEERRLTGTILDIFSCAAILLTVFGVYSVMAHSVVQRRRELGMRMALGATPQQSFSIVLLDASKLGFIGIVVGLLLTLVLSRVVRSQLPGIQAFDPLLWTGVAVVVGLLAVFAAAIPARRASRINPLQVLRSS